MEIKNIKPRNHCLIENKYDILNSYEDDFHIVIYYLNNYKTKIIIRKMNNNMGWNYNIDLKIYEICDLEIKYELISLGSNVSNCKIVNYNTNIKIKKKEYIDQKIPKTIIQTNKSRVINDKALYESILTFIELNPEYEYKFFDNIECRNFIKYNFDDKILNYYDKLIPGAFQADLFRYCYLYINGGCYFDCKNILKQPISNILKEDDTLILCQDIDEDCFYNSIIMTEPKNKIFMNAINIITNNIDNFDTLYDLFKKKVTKKKPYYGTLNITGPNLLYISAKGHIDYDRNVTLKHFIDGDYKNYKNLKIVYKNEIFALKSYYSWKESNNHYNKLWVKKEILYNQEINYKDMKILIYPNNNLNYNINNDKIILRNANKKTKDIIKFKIISNNDIYFKDFDINRKEIYFSEIINSE